MKLRYGTIVEDAREARAAGWRYFRVTALGNGARERGEARCPASAEAGFKTTFAACPIRCNGANGGVSVVIQAHGATARRVQG